MSSTSAAPAPKDNRPAAPAEEAPFAPHAFPTDLLDGQRELAEKYAELHALRKRLPWSREPHEGWSEVTERGQERPGREASPGWDPDEDKQFDKLMRRLRELAWFVQGHEHWEACRAHGADMVAARQALKRAARDVPGPAALDQQDVDTAA
ncbi:hypothetical protein [Streptomyces sp. NPDC046976]|uniref:hypothetical protein n=1 Tax=Streptomyces sp. NPDC046976 TaxID=3155258 RepID=UPI0033DD4127